MASVVGSGAIRAVRKGEQVLTTPGQTDIGSMVGEVARRGYGYIGLMDRFTVEECEREIARQRGLKSDALSNIAILETVLIWVMRRDRERMA